MMVSKNRLSEGDVCPGQFPGKGHNPDILGKLTIIFHLPCRPTVLATWILSQSLGFWGNYAGAGYFQQLLPTVDDRGVIVETDSSGNRLGPIDVLEQWRYDERFGCKSAFSRDIDD